jgi:hypothetical protein
MIVLVDTIPGHTSDSVAVSEVMITPNVAMEKLYELGVSRHLTPKSIFHSAAPSHLSWQARLRTSLLSAQPHCPGPWSITIAVFVPTCNKEGDIPSGQLAHTLGLKSLGRTKRKTCVSLMGGREPPCLSIRHAHPSADEPIIGPPLPPHTQQRPREH